MNSFINLLYFFFKLPELIPKVLIVSFRIMAKKTFSDLVLLQDCFDLTKPWPSLTSDISDVMKKSVITPGFEQLDHVANSNTSKRKLKLERKVS